MDTPARFRLTWGDTPIRFLSQVCIPMGVSDGAGVQGRRSSRGGVSMGVSQLMSILTLLLERSRKGHQVLAYLE